MTLTPDEASIADRVRLPIERAIGRFPGISLVVGLSAGVLVGWLVKRR